MAACFGLGLLTAYGPAPHDGAAWNGTVRVRGVVEEVRAHPGGRVNIVAGDVRDADTGASLPGRLLWTWTDPPAMPRVGRGFEAALRIRELRGRANFGLSSGEEHWTRLGVRHRAYTNGNFRVVWGHEVSSVRERLLERVSALLPEGPGGGTIRALLFGDRLLMEPGFMDRIRRSGLAHSLALSGLHLALVAGFGVWAAWAAGRLFPRVLLRVPRQKMAVLLALPAVLAYLWLGGFATSLLRAALMLAALTLHLFRGVRSHPQDTLFAAVAALVLMDSAAAHDLSLQLSVLAVAGIVLFMPLFTGWLAPLDELGPVWRPFRALALLAAVSVCANLFILPVQVLYFSEAAAHIWLNLLWLPVLSFAVLPLSFLGLAVSILSAAAAEACFFLAALGVEALDHVLRALDGAGWLRAPVVLRPPGMQILGYWVVLLAGSALAAASSPRCKPLAFLGLGLLLMTIPAVGRELSVLRERVELTVLDTGMSQAIFVRGASGATILVDGGGGWGSDYDPGRALVGPALAWNHPPRVDGVLLTHVDADHVRGLFYILDSFEVGWFGWSGLVDGTGDSRRLQDALRRGTWPVRALRAGDRVHVEPGLWLDVLHPPASEQGISDNETSLMLRLVWKGRGLALLPGDAEKRALGLLLRDDRPIDAEVLVLPHHGSKSSLLPSLYGRVGARWAVAACGPANRFGFPHPAVVEACERAGSAVLTTAVHGAVRFEWREGRDAAVTSARPRPAGRDLTHCAPPGFPVWPSRYDNEKETP
jgi:competence protein ComEC